MSDFKTIEKLGLEVRTIAGCKVVFARDIETILQSAQVVYEVENSAGINSWLHIEAIGAKSKALLISITPIKKKTKAEAALEFVEKYAKNVTNLLCVPEEAQRILEMDDEE